MSTEEVKLPTQEGEARLPDMKDFSKLFNARGVFFYRQMFYEHSTPASRKTSPPVFTLKVREHEGLPSAYQVYMDSVDEYDAATKLCPSLKEWDKLKNADWFLNGDPTCAHDGLLVWRDHMKARDASAMKELLISKAENGDTAAMKAVLAETKAKAPVGRKTKKVKADTATQSRVVAFNKKTGK